ncbi:anti-phytochrome antibody reactive [Micractinium conductrix]|uniref:Anti-phytochrome antibody reactive n=1 Tax=Micractinium conductrix TaxID=554055 RepID=A0A2P6VA95_9CHLO|nr:anti-phytochrome antibody reactive [Micractinium conductrix]|eukprot:PSC71013.1 anti-phytochrome antibody reactive [Micractinium conductrix]
MAATQALMSAQTVRAPAASTSGRRTAAAAAAARRPALARPASRRGPAPPRALNELMMLADLDIDWSDPDTQVGALGAVLGLALGIGAPAFYASRDNRDEERLEELRALNRATKEETGEYMSQEEINAIRPARWTDRREFVDND